MNEQISNFREESEKWIDEALELLENAEESADLKISDESLLEEYVQKIDQVVAGAKSLYASQKVPALEEISKFTELCKIVGYKGSQIDTQEDLYPLVVAFLLDATEIVAKLIANLEKDQPRALDEIASKTFLDRLKWISEKFEADLSDAPDLDADESAKAHGEIDAILQQLGLN